MSAPSFCAFLRGKRQRVAHLLASESFPVADDERASTAFPRFVSAAAAVTAAETLAEEDVATALAKTFGANLRVTASGASHTNDFARRARQKYLAP